MVSYNFHVAQFQIYALEPCKYQLALVCMICMSQLAQRHLEQNTFQMASGNMPNTEQTMIPKFISHGC